MLLAACVPPRGGWDVEGLLQSEPSLAEFEGSRIGDMVPFPALAPTLASPLDLGAVPIDIALVACRYRDEQIVRVRGGGAEWPKEWARRAVVAMNRAVVGVEVVLDSPTSSAARTFESSPAESGEVPSAASLGAASEIEVRIIQETADEGPDGLGDTLVECDVTPTDESGAVRGEVVEASIRMRRARLDVVGGFQEATAEEWVGAFMHELGHALGFAGHAAMGSTSLVRDQMVLRQMGRRALEDESRPDTTLGSLYALAPGQRLGTRALRAESVDWLRALGALQEARAQKGQDPIGIFASAGDREARLVWRYADGSRLEIRFPAWRSELRSGQGITLVPAASTRRAIALERE